MSYLALTDADREAMLETIGVSSVEELFADLPDGVRLGRELELPPALSEQELNAYFEALAAENAHVGAELSFLGAGMYDHYVPAIVDAVLQRGEFLTAYTPYQPELSQGVLQAIFEYQTAICELTGMDVSNASGYDGTTVAADACFIAKHATGRSKVVVTEATNPQVRQVVKTYAPGFGLEVVEVPHRDGATDPDELARGGRRRRLRDLPAAELLRRARAGAGPRRGRERRRGAARSPTSTRSRSACSRRRGTTAARSRSARGRRRGTTSPTAGRTTASSPHAPSSSGGCPAGSSARRLTPRGSAAMSSPSRRASSTSGARRRPPTSRPTRRCSRWPGSSTCRGSGRRGSGRWGRPAWPRRAREGAARAPARVSGSDNIQGVCRARRTARAGGRPRRPASGASTPATPLGRDYPGMDDVLLVALTEKRTPDEIDRLAEVLGAREADLREVAAGPARRPAAAARGPARGRGARPSSRRAEPPRLPELAEPELVRHFTELSTRNFGIDTGFYPLGSCTMKHNPRDQRAARRAARLPRPPPAPGGGRRPGRARLCWELQEILAEITGLDAVSLQPAAGSQGELTGLMLMRAYFADRGEGEQRRKVVDPRHRARHEPGERDDGRLRAHAREDRRAREHRRRGPARQGRRAHRRADAHEPVDARALRREHRGDRARSSTAPARSCTTTART